MPKRRKKPAKPAAMPIEKQLNLRALKGKFHLACRLGKLVGLAVLEAGFRLGEDKQKALVSAQGAMYAAMSDILGGQE